VAQGSPKQSPGHWLTHNLAAVSTQETCSGFRGVSRTMDGCDEDFEACSARVFTGLPSQLSSPPRS
jgi:hypothetical protein